MSKNALTPCDPNAVTFCCPPVFANGFATEDLGGVPQLHSGDTPIPIALAGAAIVWELWVRNLSTDDVLTVVDKIANAGSIAIVGAPTLTPDALPNVGRIVVTLDTSNRQGNDLYGLELTKSCGCSDVLWLTGPAT